MSVCTDWMEEIGTYVAAYEEGRYEPDRAVRVFNDLIQRNQLMRNSGDCPADVAQRNWETLNLIKKEAQAEVERRKSRNTAYVVGGLVALATGVVGFFIGRNT